MIIVYAHPDRKGHCGYILNQILEKTKTASGKEAPLVIDLYSEEYSPLLTEDELYTHGNKSVSSRNKEIQEIFKKQRNFIFIYPTWWNNMPAILKGFTDRVFTPGFAYKFSNHIPKGLLEGKAVAITTTGSSGLLYKIFSGKRSLKVLTKDVLSFSGLSTKNIQIGNARSLNDKNKKNIEKAVEKTLSFLGKEHS